MAVDPSTDQRTIIDFDQHTQEYRDNWQAISDANIASCPVAFSKITAVSGWCPTTRV